MRTSDDGAWREDLSPLPLTEQLNQKLVELSCSNQRLKELSPNFETRWQQSV